MKFLYETFLDRPDLTFLEEFHWNGVEKIHKSAGMLAVINSSEYLPKKYSVIKLNLKMRTGEFTKIVDSRFIWSLVLNWFLTDEDFFNKVGLYSDRIDHFKKIVK